jgi:hypothetical protein
VAPSILCAGQRFGNFGTPRQAIYADQDLSLGVVIARIAQLAQSYSGEKPTATLALPE